MRRRAFLATAGQATVGAVLAGGRYPRSAASQATAPPAQLRSLTQELDQRIPALMHESKVPGVSIVLVRDARIAWHREYGVADAASGIPVDRHTVFEAQSMSKPVFAYAVMKLKERGVLDLDTPLTKYTPDRILPDDPRLDLITARRVLSHTSGLQNWRTKEEPLAIHFTPGERWEYSGEGYSYLQSVVTRLAGHVDPNRCEDLESVHVCASDIDAYLKTNILAPFGMSSSTYTWNARYGRHAARPHDEDGKAFDKPRTTDIHAARYASAGSLKATPTDYARFLIEVISQKPADRFHIAPATLAEMTRPVIKVPEDPRNTSWALGWQIFNSDHGDLIAHGGDDTGMHCFCAASINQRSAFVIMTNAEGGLPLLRNYMYSQSMDHLLTG